MIERYGRKWPDGTNDLTIELAAFKMGLTDAESGLGKAQHFRNVVDALWNREGSPMRFDWHPWAEAMLDAACEHKYLAVAGCASSGKSDFFALWGIVNYLADPANTTVILTSTSLKDSRLRIWGRTMKYWNAVPGLPGKPVDSLGMINYRDPTTGKASTSAGIFLIAGDAKKANDSVGKMIGFKNRTVIVIADELAELSPAILDAALGNLSAANPNFQLVGISNPSSYYDPFGRLSKPKDGWGSITSEDSAWETDFGWCVRFDGEKSPNVLAGKTIYPYMIRPETLEEKKRTLGENSPQYWRMYRGFWCPTGKSAGLFTEQDMVQHCAGDRAVDWVGQPERVAFLDTAFSQGGDRAIVQFGSVGAAEGGMTMLLLDEGFVHLKSDVTLNEPVNFQIAKQFKEVCIENGVRIGNAGVDATSGGAVFCDILAAIWGTGFYRCQFGGAASERQASAADGRTCREAFYDRVSEIWGMGAELIRTGQLKGVYFELIQELTARLYETHKRGEGSCIAVESKRKMRSRTGKSPDIADAALGLVDLCRERFGLDSVAGDSLVHGDDERDPWDWALAESDRLCGGGVRERVFEDFFHDHGFIPLN